MLNWRLVEHEKLEKMENILRFHWTALSYFSSVLFKMFKNVEATVYLHNEAKLIQSHKTSWGCSMIQRKPVLLKMMFTLERVWLCVTPAWKVCRASSCLFSESACPVCSRTRLSEEQCFLLYLKTFFYTSEFIRVSFYVFSRDDINISNSDI